MFRAPGPERRGEPRRGVRRRGRCDLAHRKENAPRGWSRCRPTADHPSILRSRHDRPPPSHPPGARGDLYSDPGQVDRAIGPPQGREKVALDVRLVAGEVDHMVGHIVLEDTPAAAGDALSPGEIRPPSDERTMIDARI